MKNGIALVGQLCSGKTALAKKLLEGMPNAEWTPFAKRLKELCIDMYGMDPNPDRKDRRLLQTVADAMRSVDPDVFVNYVLQNPKYKNTTKIIDDTRFINEMQQCKANNILIVRIQVHEDVRMERIAKLYPNITKEQLNHVSETEMNTEEAQPYYDLFVKNNNAEDLKQAVAQINAAFFELPTETASVCTVNV